MALILFSEILKLLPYLIWTFPKIFNFIAINNHIDVNDCNKNANAIGEIIEITTNAMS